MATKKLFKRIFGFVCLLLAVFALFSCDAITESAELTARRQLEKDAQTVLTKTVFDVSDATAITSDVTLTTSNKNFPNVTITWSSSEPDVISAKGRFSGASEMLRKDMLLPTEAMPLTRAITDRECAL